MNTQTIDAIHRSTQGSLDGTISFPQVVQNLMEAGVSRYHVDFLRSEKTCYLRSDESHIESLSLPGDVIAHDFDGASVAAAVRASQTEGQTFPDFVRRVKRAGCIGYFAYLDGRCVVYLGRLGQEHVERFPSAQ